MPTALTRAGTECECRSKGKIAAREGIGRLEVTLQAAGRLGYQRERTTATMFNSTRRFAARSWRVTKAVWGFARSRCPKWMLPVLAACLFIPGPLDEVLVLAVVAYPVLRSAEARRELAAAVSEAWRR